MDSHGVNKQVLEHGVLHAPSILSNTYPCVWCPIWIENTICIFLFIGCKIAVTGGLDSSCLHLECVALLMQSAHSIIVLHNQPSI